MSRYRDFGFNDENYKKNMNLKYKKPDNFFLKLEVKDGLVRQEMCGDSITGLLTMIKTLKIMQNKIGISKELLDKIINDVLINDVLNLEENENEG